MRILVFIVALVFALPVCAQGFFETLPDIPLMDGLVEVEEEAFSFDKPEGRILVGAAFVDKRIDEESLLTYYQQSLPQFGWRQIDAYSYFRNQERMEISIDEYNLRDRFDRILEIRISP